jgi:hypothetical protein
MESASHRIGPIVWSTLAAAPENHMATDFQDRHLRHKIAFMCPVR